MSQEQKENIISGLIPSITNMEPIKEQIVLTVGKKELAYTKVDPKLVEAASEQIKNRILPDNVAFYPATGWAEVELQPFGPHSLIPASPTDPYDDTPSGVPVLLADETSTIAAHMSPRDLQQAVNNTKKEEEYVMAVPAGLFIRNMLTEGGLSIPELDEDLEHTYFVRRSWCEKSTEWLQLLPYIVFYKRVEGRLKIFVYQRGKGVGEERLAGNYSIGVGGHINPHDRYDLMNHVSMHGRYAVDNTTIVDHGLWRSIHRNIVREVAEEVEMSRPKGEHSLPINLTDLKGLEGMGTPFYKLKGPLSRMAMFLDYTATVVEKVHLGLFIGIEVPADVEIETSEECLIDVGFVDAEEIYKNRFSYVHNDNIAPEKAMAFENWTRAIIESIVETKDFNDEFDEEKVEIDMEEGEDKKRVFEFNSIAKHVARQDRWKIGTLSRIVSDELDFYETNVFMKV